MAWILTDSEALTYQLDTTDCVITIDTIGCQKQIAKQIIDQKGHYCLAVKTNQAILYEEIKEYFSYGEKEGPEKLSTYETIEKKSMFIFGRMHVKSKQKKRCRTCH